MKKRNLFTAKARIAVAGLIIFNSVIFSYSQNSRPRYSNSQPSQSSDMIPVDTVIGLRMNTYLSSKTAHVGDKFTATVTLPVYVDGKEAIPAGATIDGRVTQVRPAKRMAKSGLIAIEFDVINLPNGLSTQIVGVLTSDDPETQKQIDDENQVSGGKGKDATVFVGGSGVLGAILGGVAGGGKGAAVGGAVGAGVGLATVLLSKGEEATVPTGTEFGIRLKQPLPVPTEANTYDPAQDNKSPQNNSPNANPTDSSADARAQASQGSARDIEHTSKPETRYPQPAERDASTNLPPSRDSQPVNSNDADPLPIEEDLPLSSQEMLRRAQKALNEEGYYEGEIDGVMTQRVENSLKTYQREHRLQETGILDMETAKSLRIIRANKSPGNNDRAAIPPSSSPQNTARGSTEPASPRVTIETPSTTTSSRPSSNRHPVETDSQPQSTPDMQRAGNSLAGASKLQRQAAELLAEYQKLIGVRLTGTGIELDGKATSDDEISLLYAFDSFANSTQLYARLLPSLQAQQSIRSATLALAREARKTDRVFTTSSTRWVNVLNPKWDAIRQDILKLMFSFNINTAELDN
jgi:hypothetical protein